MRRLIQIPLRALFAVAAVVGCKAADGNGSMDRAIVDGGSRDVAAVARDLALVDADNDV